MHSIYYILCAGIVCFAPLSANNTYRLPEEEALRARLAQDFTYVDRTARLSQHFAATELNAAEALNQLRQRYNRIDSKIHRLAAKARECELMHALYADQASNLIRDLAAQNIVLCKQKTLSTLPTQELAA